MTYKYKCDGCGEEFYREWKGKSFKSMCGMCNHDIKTARVVPGQPEPVVVWMFTYITKGSPSFILTRLCETRNDARYEHKRYTDDDFVCSPIQSVVLDPPRRKGK